MCHDHVGAQKDAGGVALLGAAAGGAGEQPAQQVGARTVGAQAFDGHLRGGSREDHFLAVLKQLTHWWEEGPSAPGTSSTQLPTALCRLQHY